MKKVLLFLSLVLISNIIKAEPNYVYHEASTNSLEANCSSIKYRSTMFPSSYTSVDIAFKVDYQDWWNQARIYYTIDGSNPQGSFGIAGNASTHVVNATYQCGYEWDPNPEVVMGTIPGYACGTQVKYIVSAWHSGGGNEIFANGPGALCSNCGTITNSYTLATVYEYFVNTTTWSGSWNNGTPDINKGVVFSSNYDMNSNPSVETCKCYVNSNVTISANKYLKVDYKITNSDTITIEHQGSLVQVNETNNNLTTGTYIINKTSRPYKEYDYNYWSSPLADETTVDAFVTNSTELLAGSNAFSEGSPSNRLWEYDPSGWKDTANDGVNDVGTGEWDHYAGAMTKGKGYIAMGAGAEIPFNTNYYSGDFQQSIIFQGTNLNNGTFTHNLVPDQDAANATDLSDNLIGNPYPSALDIQDFYAVNSSFVGPTAYFWTHSAAITNAPNSYYTYNYNAVANTASLNMPTAISSSANATEPIRYVASGQGFIVQLKGNSTQAITFTNAMREIDNNNHLLKMNSDTQRDIIWVNLTDENGLYRQVAVSFLDMAQDVYDICDSPRMNYEGEPNFYTLATDSDEKLAIQGLSVFNENKTVPIGITTTYTGAYQIALDHTEGIFNQGQTIYLEDTYLDIIHNLSNGNYTYTQDVASDITDRFLLRFTTSALSNEEQALDAIAFYPNPVEDIMYINYKGVEPLQIDVYDITGKLIITKNNVDLINFSTFTRGWYVIKATNSTNSISKKILIN